MTAGSGWDIDDSDGRGLALDQLAEELERLADEGGTPDREALAKRFGLELADVDQCQRAVGALGVLGRPTPRPRPPTTSPDGPTVTLSGSSCVEPLEYLGGYELRGELARGGMGAVYRAWHPGLAKEVAVKVLLAGKGASPKQLERFRIEGRAAARLRHPHIVPVHDIAQDQGYPFLIMDLVEGESLAERLERAGPLPTEEAAEIGAKLAEALHYAHGQLILHRDLKPGNVLVDREGAPLLTDFGLAKVMDTEGSDGLTQSGQVLGTVPFMAPEQASGNLVDRRTDVYGLGATIYALLTGQAPFTGELMLEVLGKVAVEDPPSPSKLRAEVDADLETIVLTCLEKDPARRYPTARALGEDLRRWLAHEPIQARPPGLRDRAAKWIRRNPIAFRALMLGSVLLVVGGTGAAAWVTQARRAEREALITSVRDNAQVQLRGLSWIGDKNDDAPIGRALAALHATQRWRDLAPDDPEAAQALYRAAMALGDEARKREQWALATQAYGLGLGLGDDEQVRVNIARVERERAAEAERRKAAVLQALDDAESGKLGRQQLGLDQAVDDIVGYRDDVTLGLLCERLEAVAKAAWETRGKLLLETSPEALREGVRSCLARRWEVSPQHAMPDTRRLLGEARARFLRAERAKGEKRTFLQICASRQRDVLGARLDVAEVACRALGRIGRRTPRVVRALGRYLQAECDPARAVPAGLALCRLGGREAFAIVTWARRSFGPTGLFSARVGRHLAQFDDADLLLGKDAGSYLARAEARREMGDLKGARADVEAGLALDAENPRLWHQRALLRREERDYEGALQDLDRAIGLAPKTPRLHYARGIVLRSMKRYAEARGELTRAIEADANFAPGWAARGQVRRMLKDMSGSIEDYDRAIQLDPSRAESWAGRAQTRLELRHFPLAASDAQRARVLDPTHAGALVLTGNLALMQRDFVRASAAFTRLLQIQPRQGVALSNRAVARYMLGDYRGSLKDLQVLHELRPKDAQVWIRTGSVFKALKRWDESEKAYARAMALAPNDSGPVRQRGLMRLKKGDGPGAVADLNAALRLDPKDAVAALYLARIARANKRFEAARALGERARRDAKTRSLRVQAEELLQGLPK